MNFEYFSAVGAIVFAYLLISILNSPYGVLNAFKRDDTDGKQRSGLIVYVDHKTGVQYVGNQMGGLTVRVDENGKPMRVPNVK